MRNVPISDANMSYPGRVNNAIQATGRASARGRPQRGLRPDTLHRGWPAALHPRLRRHQAHGPDPVRSQERGDRGRRQFRDALLSGGACQGHAHLGPRADSRCADSRRRHRGGGAGDPQGAAQAPAPVAAAGLHPANITYVAMSHYHLDHTANANLFAGSTWIVQQAEYDAMFGAQGIRHPRCVELRQAQGLQTHYVEQRGS